MKTVTQPKRLGDFIYFIKTLNKTQHSQKIYKLIFAEYLLLKYTDILMRINELAILYDWDFDRSAEYLLLTRRERQECIKIIDIKQGSTAEKIKKHIIIKE